MICPRDSNTNMSRNKDLPKGPCFVFKQGFRNLTMYAEVE